MSNSSVIVDALVSAIAERPDDFVICKYRLTDKKTDFEIWIRNGMFFYEVNKPFEAKFNLLQKIRLYYYFEKLKAWNACSFLEN